MSLNTETFNRLSEGLWSKSDRTNPERHHLFIYHLLDSAAVAARMWDEALCERTKTDVSAVLNVTPKEARKILAYWCGLHDIGKASPVFQKRIREKTRGPAAPGFPMPGWMSNLYHSEISGWYIRDHHLAPKQVDIAISGHHGSWKCDYQIDPRSAGTSVWQDYRNATAELLRNLIGLDELLTDNLPDSTDSNAFSVWLSGFVSVVDWLASNEEFFSFLEQVKDFTDYYRNTAETNAARALLKTGWIGWKASGQTMAFQDMFHFAPRDLQTRVFETYEIYAPKSPFLLILEAPTGIGKTEIALFLADRWNQRARGSGLYIAMPSQATSNQIYDRTVRFIGERYPRDLAPVSLAHGQAAWSERVNNLRIHAIEDEDATGVVITDWFMDNRKRSLLTPFGVGTVDQAFLGVLQTRHFFVRLMGLRDKVVVFDEVHAYDSYMQTLFRGLLAWLRHLGASVIVLSATLPETFRREILASYCGDSALVARNLDYPRVSMATPRQTPVVRDLKTSITPDQHRELQIEWLRESDLAEWLGDQLAKGGCAAVLCNTVKKAQALYETLEKLALVPADDLYLFHAGFPLAWRNQIEEEILRKFGRQAEAGQTGPDCNPSRPHKAIVVATQVIEQSLDLDFDVMVSEVAPVDLILQRAGRLHRHYRERPPRLSAPTLALLEPDALEGNTPSFGASQHIYRYSVLAKTYHLLHRVKRLDVLEQTRALIEAVYGEAPDGVFPPALLELIEQSELKEGKDERIAWQKASQKLIPAPEDENLLYASLLGLNDNDDLSVREIYRALTRNTDGLSLEAICLFTQGEGAYLDLACQGQPINLNRMQSDNPLIGEILKLRVSIHNAQAVRELLGSSAVRWAPKTAALRSYPILVFREGLFETDRLHFRLSKKLGLSISPREV